MQTAQDILEAIAQRQDTLLRCAQTIVDWQEGFFRAGEQALRRLIDGEDKARPLSD